MRMSKSAFATASLIALLVAGASPVCAGVVFVMETTYHSGAKAEVEGGRVFVMKPNLKMEMMARGSSAEGKMPEEMIYRGDLRQMIMVDHGEKTYMVIDPKTMEKMAGQVPGGAGGGADMQKAMKELEKQMADLGPEEREMMEKMLKDKMPPGATLGFEPPRPEYRKTDNKETMSGYPCVRYDIYLEKEKTQELWVTDWKNIEGSEELMAVFKDMSEFYAEMMKSLVKLTGGLMGGDRSPMEDFANVDGFPVVTRNFQGGELQSETKLKSVTKRDLNSGDFEAPKGYEPRTMGME